MSKFSIAVRLFVITAVAALCLAFTNQITAPITKINNDKAFAKALSDALPQAKVFKPLDPISSKDETITINSVNEGFSDKAMAKSVGYVVKVTCSEGYGGNVCVMVGIDKKGEIVKTIISSPFSETPGLGMKAKEPAFTDQYTGKKGELKVVKGEANESDEIVAISSATITSRAVTKCVNAALEAVANGSQIQSEKANEAKKTYDEKHEQSKAELNAVEEIRKDEPVPTIKEESEKEEKENEQ